MAMFQRRHQLPLGAKIGQWIWPRMGWRRTLSYFWHRLQRIPGTPSSIATGFAVGAGIAMTPFYGMHIVTAGLIAWAVRGNVFASVLGAQIANPWTAPPLWFASYYVGAWMMGINTSDRPPNFVSMFKGLTESVLNADMATFGRRVWPVFSPMVAGSVPMGIVTGIIAYFALLPVLKAVHQRRIARRQSRIIPMSGAGI